MTAVAVKTPASCRMPDPQDFQQHLRAVARASEHSVTSLYLHTDLRSKRAAVEQLPVLATGGEHEA